MSPAVLEAPPAAAVEQSPLSAPPGAEMGMGGFDLAGMIQQASQDPALSMVLGAMLAQAMAASDSQRTGMSPDELASEIRKRKPASASSVVPSELKEESDRKDLASRLQRILYASDSGRGRLTQRWDRNRAYRQNRTIAPPKAPHNGAEFFHFPLVQPRIDQREAQLVGNIASADTFFRIKRPGPGQDTVVENESVLQWFLDSSGFKSVFADAIDNTMIANLGVIRVAWTEREEAPAETSITGPYSGLSLESVGPENFFVWPPNGAGIEGADWVSHRYETTLSRVTENRKLKLWLDDGVVVPTNENLSKRETDVQSDADTSGDFEDQRVWIYDGIYRGAIGEGDAKDYRVVWEEKSLQILLVYEWDCPFRPYADFMIKREDNKYYTEGSPCDDLQTLQALMNSLINETVWGIQRRAHGNAYLSKSADEDTFDSLAPGEVGTARSVADMKVFFGNFDMAGMDFLFQMIMSAADSASKVSDTLSGAPSVERDSTATEQNIKYQGFQISGSADIERVTPGLIKLAKLALWLIKKHFAKWRAVYPFLEVVDKAMLDGAFIVEPSVKSPEDSPQMQAQQYESLLQTFLGLASVQIPAVQAMVSVIPEMLRGMIRGSTISNRDDIIRKIDEAEAIANQQQAAAQAAMGQGVNLDGSPVTTQPGPGVGDPSAGMGDPAQGSGEAVDSLLSSFESQANGGLPA